MRRVDIDELGGAARERETMGDDPTVRFMYQWPSLVASFEVFASWWTGVRARPGRAVSAVEVATAVEQPER